MNSRKLMLLPLLVLGLTSCTPDTHPKYLSYNDAISYINKNSKGKATPRSGYVTYTCKVDTPESPVLERLYYFGVTDETIEEHLGGNDIDSVIIKDKYLDNSDGTISAHDNGDLPLMYLNEGNFKKFVDNQEGFSYTLTNIKEFIMYQATNDCYFSRYYDSNLRLYKFEIHNVKENEEFDVIQTFNY